MSNSKLAFLYIFRAHHPNQRLSVDQIIGIKLLGLLTLLTTRPGDVSTTSLSGTPVHRRHPMETMHQPRSDPADPPNIAEDRERCLKAIIASNQARRGVAAPIHRGVLMTDILRSFMSLSAEITVRRGQKINSDWMLLAAEAMLLAALEQPVKEDLMDLDDIDATFAWGWKPGQRRQSPNINNEIDLINEMFYDTHADGEITGWNDMRNHFKAMFFAVEDRNWNTHIEIVGRYFPKEDFEKKLLDYSKDVFTFQWDQKKPILVQLENGTLEGLGLDHDQTSEFIGRVFAAG